MEFGLSNSSSYCIGVARLSSKSGLGILILIIVTSFQLNRSGKLNGSINYIESSSKYLVS